MGDADDDRTPSPRGPREERDAAREVRHPRGVPQDQLGPATGQSIPDESAMGMRDDALEDDEVPPATEDRPTRPD